MDRIFSPIDCAYIHHALHVYMCIHMLMYQCHPFSEEEEDDEMDFSGVKTVNLQVSSSLHHHALCCYLS